MRKENKKQRGRIHDWPENTSSNNESHDYGQAIYPFKNAHFRQGLENNDAVGEFRQVVDGFVDSHESAHERDECGLAVAHGDCDLYLLVACFRFRQPGRCRFGVWRFFEGAPASASVFWGVSTVLRDVQ